MSASTNEYDAVVVGAGPNGLTAAIFLAHPLDGHRAGLLYRALDETAVGLGPDGDAYRTLMRHFAAKGIHVSNTLFSPIAIPRAPITMARFGLSAIGSVERLTTKRFQTDQARAIFAGSAAHAMVPLDRAATAGYGLFLTTLAHSVGWPVALGGSQRITDALVAILKELNGEVVLDHRVNFLDELPPTNITMLDVTPRQLLQLGGDRVPSRYQKTLRRYRYGPGVF